ncbi:hypothetical protein RJ640_003928 [Escallonia rubra]|uniref:Late embryogenesis abundant protein LEA-2 subgroup domain-containing protein n=1 Tax=Escallonia rubra TaxID=112253 RepID=A0AA88RB18_9ASTE|nr:hypothetical protein RJ640_003928 [Escallonia rubra]
MSETTPVLQRPPGYKDPDITVQRPPPGKPVALPPSFYPPRRRKSCCRTCCCFLCLFIIMATLLCFAAGGFFYVWFEPRVPVLHLKSLKIPQFNVTANADGTTMLNARTLIGVEVKNLNSELRLIYERTNVHINSQDGLDLGSASLPGFTQEKKNVTVLKIATQVRNALVDDDTGKKLKEGFKSKSLPVSVVVQTAVGAGGKGWNTWTVGVDARCGDLTLKQLEGGAMPRCRIKVFKW